MKAKMDRAIQVIDEAAEILAGLWAESVEWRTPNVTAAVAELDRARRHLAAEGRERESRARLAARKKAV